MSKKGLLIILSGPSGVGKGTIRQEILKDSSLNLFYSVSLTTREMRPGEVEGRDYYFVSDEEFDENLAEGNLLEWNRFVHNRYGTPKNKVEEKRVSGQNVLLEIDVNGTEQVFRNVEKDGLVSIFLMPPSFAELEARIRKRSTEPDEVIQERLSKAAAEMDKAKNYDYVVVNDDIEKAADKIKAIIHEKMSAE